MPSIGTIGYGARLFRGPAGDVEVPNVLSISPGSPEVSQIEVTHLQSPGRRKEYISGLIDSHDMTFECRYSPATYNTLNGVIGTAEQWKIVFPDGLSSSFPGNLTKVETSLTVEDVVNLSCTVRVTGDMVITLPA